MCFYIYTKMYFVAWTIDQRANFLKNRRLSIIGIFTKKKNETSILNSSWEIHMAWLTDWRTKLSIKQILIGKRNLHQKIWSLILYSSWENHVFPNSISDGLTNISKCRVTLPFKILHFFYLFYSDVCGSPTPLWTLCRAWPQPGRPAQNNALPLAGLFLKKIF